VIIDHHPETHVIAPFVDIRPKYGATASIMTEYLRAAKIKPSVKLATGLLHAIKTDTKYFARQTLMEDVSAFQFLFRHANIHLASRIEQADLRIDFLRYFKTAIENMRRRQERIFAHLGPVVNPDVCVLIADFFMRVESVNWSVISGTFQQKLIIVFRNDGIRKNAGKVANQSFGQIGSAGGHKNMARAEIPLAILDDKVDYKDSKKLQRWIVKQIVRKADKK
jgi:nanoRNase/pAp phosphatase (c-di-AMP/oligoRNAs hydrolase)